MQEALDTALKVVTYLGEPIPTNLSKEELQREMESTLKSLNQKSSWDAMPAMKDPQKIKAMVSLFCCVLKMQ